MHHNHGLITIFCYVIIFLLHLMLNMYNLSDIRYTVLRNSIS